MGAVCDNSGQCALIAQLVLDFVLFMPVDDPRFCRVIDQVFTASVIFQLDRSCKYDIYIRRQSKDI